jgi:hypothetical protein
VPRYLIERNMPAGLGDDEIDASVPCDLVTEVRAFEPSEYEDSRL